MKQVRKRKTNIIYQLIHAESRKMAQMNLFAGQGYICRTDVEDRHVNTGEEGKGV